MYYPSIQDIQEIIQHKHYDIVPIVYQIPNHFQSPSDILKILKTHDHDCFMFENASLKHQQQRYSYLGFQPKMHMTCFQEKIYINNNLVQADHPHDVIREILSHYRCPQILNLPPFQGGLVGYFGYEYFHYNEPSLKVNEKNIHQIADMHLMLFETIICIDHQQNLIQLITHIPLNDLENDYQKAQQLLQKLTSLLKTKPQEPEPLKLQKDFLPSYNKQEYCQMVKQAKRHIYEGDIFQIVLSNRWHTIASGSLFQTYQILKDINPSPYLFYLQMSNIEIIGSSPETLVKQQDHRIYTYPLAGTRPRGRTHKEDEQNEKELLNDPKELAEHHMLIDLGRNDIGKVSELSSVRILDYMQLLKFSHVMHIGSTITGYLSKDKDALDVIDALLPAGTLSGAPKIKASSLIYQLEKQKRYLYGGAIGYIDFTGQMDTCIAIRFAYKINQHIFVSSGAGIVADSKPENEYQECCYKAAAIMEALKQADGGSI